MKCRPALDLRFYAGLADALDLVKSPDAGIFLKAPAFDDEHTRLMPKEFSCDGEACRTAANDDQIGFELAPVFQARQIQSLQDFALSESRCPNQESLRIRARIKVSFLPRGLPKEYLTIAF